MEVKGNQQSCRIFLYKSKLTKKNERAKVWKEWSKREKTLGRIGRKKEGEEGKGQIKKVYKETT